MGHSSIFAVSTKHSHTLLLGLRLLKRHTFGTSSFSACASKWEVCMFHFSSLSQAKCYFLQWLHFNCLSDVFTHSPFVQLILFLPVAFKKSHHLVWDKQKSYTVHRVPVKKVAVSMQDVCCAPRHTLKEQGHQTTLIAQKHTLRINFIIYLVFFQDSVLTTSCRKGCLF